MDDLIRRRATGSSDEFANKLGISRSSLMEYIKLLKELNAPISFDHYNNTYYYLINCKLKIGYESKLIEDSSLVELNKRNLKSFCEVVIQK
ncbi:MAG: HTH domain-containing protein [Cyclobacteriaceae bacterium]|tara:strand:+ start:8666 stop:8938 length:273 start_codon:yes stop_codon:yes gene_type:complete